MLGSVKFVHTTAVCQFIVDAYCASSQQLCVGASSAFKACLGTGDLRLKHAGGLLGGGHNFLPVSLQAAATAHGKKRMSAADGGWVECDTHTRSPGMPYGPAP